MMRSQVQKWPQTLIGRIKEGFLHLKLRSKRQQQIFLPKNCQTEVFGHVSEKSPACEVKVQHLTSKPGGGGYLFC